MVKNASAQNDSLPELRARINKCLMFASSTIEQSLDDFGLIQQFCHDIISDKDVYGEESIITIFNTFFWYVFVVFFFFLSVYY